MDISKLSKEEKDKLIKDLGGFTQSEVGHTIGETTTLQVIKENEDGTFVVKLKTQ